MNKQHTVKIVQFVAFFAFVSALISAQVSRVFAAEGVCEPFHVVYTSHEGMPGSGVSAVGTYDQSPFWAPAFSGAQWIWKTYQVEHPQEGDSAVFTLSFSLPADAGSSELLVSADDYYRISVNGTEIASEFSEGNFLPDHTHSYHIPSLFKMGSNTITFEVINAPYLYPDRASAENNPAGLLVWLGIDGTACTSSAESSGSGSGSDGTWTASGGDIAGKAETQSSPVPNSDISPENILPNAVTASVDAALSLVHRAVASGPASDTPAPRIDSDASQSSISAPVASCRYLLILFFLLALDIVLLLLVHSRRNRKK